MSQASLNIFKQHRNSKLIAFLKLRSFGADCSLILNSFKKIHFGRSSPWMGEPRRIIIASP